MTFNHDSPIIALQKNELQTTVKTIGRSIEDIRAIWTDDPQQNDGQLPFKTETS